MDPSATPKNRRLSHEDFALLLELRLGTRTADEWSSRADRLEWFINQILEISLRGLPRDVRRKWRGSVAVDATVIPTFARPDRRKKRTKKGVPPVVLRHSSDPDADWYIRNKGEADDDSERGMKVWGYEASLAVSGSDDPDGEQLYPSLVVGMAVLHKPGHQPGAQATKALRSVRERGHPALYLAGDRAYSSARPDDFQLPARALGYGLVVDYKVDQLGVQAEFAGMLQIEGAWYCPSIPEVLINATIEFRSGKIDEDLYRSRLVERWKYQVLTKAAADAEGYLRMRCPASNPNPVANCDLKPASKTKKNKGRITIPITSAVRNHAPKICTQQSITLPPEAGAKFSQPLLFGSDRWHAVYAMLRSSIEGMNGFVKDGAKEAIDDPERRRIRGVAPQSLFIAFLLCAANFRKIEGFLAQAAAEAAGKVRRMPTRRRSRSLGQWLPKPPTVGQPGSSAAPDPPLSA